MSLLEAWKELLPSPTQPGGGEGRSNNGVDTRHQGPLLQIPNPFSFYGWWKEHGLQNKKTQYEPTPYLCCQNSCAVLKKTLAFFACVCLFSHMQKWAE